MKASRGPDPGPWFLDTLNTVQGDAEDLLRLFADKVQDEEPIQEVVCDGDHGLPERVAEHARTERDRLVGGWLQSYASSRPGGLGASSLKCTPISRMRKQVAAAAAAAGN